MFWTGNSAGELYSTNDYVGENGCDMQKGVDYYREIEGEWV